MYGFIFTVCQTNNILEHETNTQLSIRISPDGHFTTVDKSAVKEFYLKKISYNIPLDLVILKASCDINKRISGFTDDGVEFSHFYQKKSFDCFYCNETKLFLLQADNKTCKNFLNQYNKLTNLDEKILPISINFDNVERNAIINGCSAKTFNDASISAKQLFGNDIFSHQEYKNIKQNGKLTSLTIEYNYCGEIYDVLISSKGSVWIRAKDISIEKAIAISKAICIHLLLN